MGAYARVGFPVTDAVYPYGLLGLSRITIKEEATSESFEPLLNKERDTGLSYGFGFDITIVEGFMANFEFISYYDETLKGADYDISALSLGIKKAF